MNKRGFIKHKLLYATLLTIFLTSIEIVGQNQFPILQKSYFPCDFFHCDAFGNLYIVRNQTILKFDSIGKQVATYDNSKNGKISSIDISNPLKIMIFYSESNKIQFIDRTLSPLDNEIDLLSIVSENVDLVCTSYSNSLWFYPTNGAMLYKANNQAVIILTVELLNQISLSDFKASQLIEYGDFIYLANPQKGVIIFDKWGSIIKQIPINYQNTISVHEDLIFYHRQDSVFCYNPIIYVEQPIFKAPSPIQQLQVTKSNLYLKLANDSIFRYSTW